MEKLTFIILGEIGVGKTTFVMSAAEERACTETQRPTLEVNFFRRRLTYGGKEYTIIFKDTVGFEGGRFATRNLIRGCDGAFLMFDEEHSSIEDLKYWTNFYEDSAEDPEWVLVKTKCDSKSQQDRNMDCRPFVNFSKQHGKPFFEISAYERKGVEEALAALVTRVLHRRQRCVTQQPFIFITLGDYEVGKTTFLRSAQGKNAYTGHTIPTLDVEYFSRQFRYGDEKYTIKFRDTAGAERHRSLSKQYARDCDGAFLLFDEKHSSIVDLERWRNFYENVAEDPEWVLVKTKCDSQSQQDRNMDCTPYVLFSKLHGKPFFEVSALEYKGVEEALEALVTRSVYRREQMKNVPQTDLQKKEVIQLDVNQPTQKSCCYR